MPQRRSGQSGGHGSDPGTTVLQLIVRDPNDLLLELAQRGPV